MLLYVWWYGGGWSNQIQIKAILSLFVYNYLQGTKDLCVFRSAIY